MPLKAWLGWPTLVAAGLALLVAAGLWRSADLTIAHETDKLQFLKGEIAKLDKDIAEVSSLREMIGAMLARKQITEVLQKDRLLTVQLLEQLARQRPAGVYLGAVREGGGRVVVTGFAASERELAAFLLNLGGSPLFWPAELVEARSESAPPRAGYPMRFTASTAIRGRQALPALAPRRVPSDVHPGDPK